MFANNMKIVCLGTTVKKILITLYEHGASWWNYIGRVKLLIRPSELSYQQSSSSKAGGTNSMAQEPEGSSLHSQPVPI
jgi:hypothetical protein